MSRILARRLWWFGAALAGLPAWAQGEARATGPEWEGAIGLLVSNGTAFMGSDERSTKLQPGFYLRWGRYSLTNASGFYTRSNDQVVRGLGVDLGHSARWKLTLGLRYDGGRRESTSGQLAGLGSVKHTVRARLGGRYHLDDHWQLGGSWSADAFGRGGGHYGEFSIERHQRASPTTTWVAGAGFSAAGDRYLQSWFGVTPEQSSRSGYAVYEPKAGLRDASVYASLRSQVAPRWVLLGGASATRLLGSAADSPLVRQRSTWSLNGGLAWNF